MIKGADQQPKSGSLAQSPTRPTSVVYSLTGPSFLGLDIEKRPLTNFTVSADGALGTKVVKLSQKPNQPKPKACIPKGKQLGGSQKAKPS